MAVKPIKPSDIAKIKQSIIPDFVISAWNKTIARNYCNGQSYFFQDEIVNEILLAGDCDRHDVFENKWLDVETIYEAEGWTVEYDKPGYNENYPANFTFKHHK